MKPMIILVAEIVVVALVVVVVVGMPSPRSDSEDSSEGHRSPRVGCRVHGSRWRACWECDPQIDTKCVPRTARDCKCRDISLNQTDTLAFEGGGDCQSERDGRKWCYVDSSSTCDDKTEEETEFDNLWLPRSSSLYSSFEACDDFEQEGYDEHYNTLGNEEFIVDYELSSDEDLEESLVQKGLRTDTPEECQATCMAFEKLCFGWTFKDFDGESGRCVLKGSQVCCNQKRKKIRQVGSISGFTCDNCSSGKCCWSTSGRCPCELEVDSDSTQFFAGGGVGQSKSATIAFVRSKQACRADRTLYCFKVGRWRATRKPSCNETDDDS